MFLLKNFILLLLFASLAVAADGMRVAHVDSKIIFEGYKGTRRAQEEYDRQVAKWEQQANLLQRELGFVKERLEKQSLMLSEEQKRELEAEFSRRDTELKNFIERIYGRNGELLKENEKVSAPIIALIRKAVTEIALSEGYDYVLDRATGAVLFWKNENDLTQKVLNYLNSR
ncbi:MAG: OmpH family outer membrane protein [Fibromonadaceae bacterium]|jgi:outer membrane protein|nr:OmpH family outer membrane protein [Fibromonadaceae bacterium]